MIFRNLGAGRSSDLIRTALSATYREWRVRYGELPPERLRTEIGIGAIRSSNPGCCYKIAGWIPDRIVRGKLYLWAPEEIRAERGSEEAVTQVELTAQRLLEAEKALGPEHAQKVFQALVVEYRLNDWETRAVRNRFFELLTEHKREARKL